MIVIAQPNEIQIDLLKQMVELIRTGKEVNTPPEKLKEYLQRADFIAYELNDNEIICTATLKNPFRSYRTKVINWAEVNSSVVPNKELGYIATHPSFREKGHCTRLLKQFFKTISLEPTYATTRKPEMIHILNKFGFAQIGTTSNKGIKLLIRNGNSIS